MIDYVECPNEIMKDDKDGKDGIETTYSVFLAGGITGCPDWQKEAVEFLEKNVPADKSLRIYNPRRETFDVNDTSITKQQITWEFQAMEEADIIIFWFPKKSICPITLYELGRYNALACRLQKVIIIGAHEDYPRKRDVVIQTRLATGDYVYPSLLHVLEETCEYTRAS